MDSGKLIIFRNYSIIAIMKPFKIYINNELVGELSMGDSYSIDLPDGKYTLYTKIDYCISPIFEINILKNEIKYFNTGHIGNTKNPFIFIRMFFPKHSLFLKELSIKKFISSDISPTNTSKLLSIPDLTSTTNVSIETTLNSIDFTKDIFSSISKIPIGTNLKSYTISTIKKINLCLGLIGILLFLFIHKSHLHKLLYLSNFFLILLSAAILSIILINLFKYLHSK